MNLDADWLKTDMDKYTIVGGEPEYCFNVIEADGVADQVVPAVAETRGELLLAGVQCRMRAMQAMQRIAAEVLTNYSTFASRDDIWQTMECGSTRSSRSRIRNRRVSKSIPCWNNACVRV